VETAGTFYGLTCFQAGLRAACDASKASDRLSAGCAKCNRTRCPTSAAQLIGRQPRLRLEDQVARTGCLARCSWGRWLVAYRLALAGIVDAKLRHEHAPPWIAAYPWGGVEIYSSVGEHLSKYSKRVGLQAVGSGAWQPNRRTRAATLGPAPTDPPRLPSIHGQFGSHRRSHSGPLLFLAPARFVHVDHVGLLDRGPGLLDHGCQGGALHLLLAYHRAQGQPDRPQMLQQLPHFPPAQPIAATQESYHRGQPGTERPPQRAGQ
jgi:hypothetical protein